MISRAKAAKAGADTMWVVKGSRQEPVRAKIFLIGNLSD